MVENAKMQEVELSRCQSFEGTFTVVIRTLHSVNLIPRLKNFPCVKLTNYLCDFVQGAKRPCL